MIFHHKFKLRHVMFNLHQVESRLSRKKADIFSLQSTLLLRTPVNMDNGHFSMSRVLNVHISLTHADTLYEHYL